MAPLVEEITGSAAIDPGIEDVVANSIRNRQNPPGQDQTMVVNMGPQHPSTHGVLRLVVEIDGETVVSLAPDVGYLHTGIEKTCEAKFYQQVRAPYRPHRLPLPHDQQPRLLPRGGEVARP